jgi:predicted cobalt transporter CbtA
MPGLLNLVLIPIAGLLVAGIFWMARDLERRGRDGVLWGLAGMLAFVQAGTLFRSDGLYGVVPLALILGAWARRRRIR